MIKLTLGVRIKKYYLSLPPFAGAKVRLAKIAQYITIFLLSAVAPYLRTPGEKTRDKNFKKIIFFYKKCIFLQVQHYKYSKDKKLEERFNANYG